MNIQNRIILLNLIRSLKNGPDQDINKALRRVERIMTSARSEVVDEIISEIQNSSTPKADKIFLIYMLALI